MVSTYAWWSLLTVVSNIFVATAVKTGPSPRKQLGMLNAKCARVRDEPRTRVCANEKCDSIVPRSEVLSSTILLSSPVDSKPLIIGQSAQILTARLDFRSRFVLALENSSCV